MCCRNGHFGGVLTGVSAKKCHISGGDEKTELKKWELCGMVLLTLFEMGMILLVQGPGRSVRKADGIKK